MKMKRLTSLAITLSLISSCRSSTMVDTWKENPRINRQQEIPGQKPADLEFTLIHDSRPENIRNADNPDFDPNSNLWNDLFGGGAGSHGDGSSGEGSVIGAPRVVDIPPPPSADKIDAYDIHNGKIDVTSGLFSKDDPELKSINDAIRSTKDGYRGKKSLLDQRDYSKKIADDLVDTLNKKKIDPLTADFDKRFENLNKDIDKAISDHNSRVDSITSKIPENTVSVETSSNTQFKTAPNTVNGQRVRNAQDYLNHARRTSEVKRGPSHVIGKQALDYAQGAVHVADGYYAEGRQEEGNFALEVATTAADIVLGFIPGVGWGKDAYEAIRGNSLLTGTELTKFERGMAVFGVITAGIGSKLAIAGKAAALVGIARAGAKEASFATDAGRVIEKMEETVGSLERMGFRGERELSNLRKNIGPPSDATFSMEIYPRGPGAATGAVPDGYVPVQRWISESEVKVWYDGGGTHIPTDIGANGRVYVTAPGVPKPGGTGNLRVDMAVPKGMLSKAGNDGWYQILSPNTSSTPIHNVKILIP